MFQISLIRTEGVGDSVEYHLYSQGKLLSPLSQFSEPSYSVHMSSTVRILLKHKNTKVPVCSGSFSTDIFPPDGFQWLPLSKSSQDSYTVLPVEVGLPRILIHVSNDMLSPVVERTESEESENSAEAYRRGTDYSQIMGKTHGRTSKTSVEFEANKILAEQFESLYLKCKSEMEEYKMKYEREKKENIDLREQVIKLKAVQEEIKINARMREEFLEQMISYREKKKTNFTLDGISEIVSNQTFYENRGSSFTPVVESKTTHFTENSLVNTCISKESLTKAKVLKRRVLSEVTNSSTSKTTHTILQDFLKKTKREGKFIRESGNTYKFGNKKVSISLKNGQLLCRVGGGFEDIERFISKNPEGNGRNSHSAKCHRRVNTDFSVKSKELSGAHRQSFTEPG